MQRPVTPSGLERVDHCMASVVLPAIDETDSVFSRHGRAVHAYLAAVAGGVKPREALALVPDAHRAACQAIELSALPHSQMGAWLAEVAFAYDYETDSGRVLEGVQDRGYTGIGPTEIPGTADLVGVDGDTVVVLDVKTGYRWLTSPEESLQLLTYALAAARAFGKLRARVGYIFVREDEEPRLVMADLEVWDLSEAALRIQKIMRGVEWARAGIEESRPVAGDHCRYCPARRGCPAFTPLLQALNTNHMDIARAALVGGNPGSKLLVIQAEDLPRVITNIKAMKGLLARLEHEAKEAIVNLGSVPSDEKGYVWAQVEVSTETLDAEIARPVLDEWFGADLAAEAIVTKPKLTKAAVEGLVRKRVAVTKEKIGATNEAVLEAIRFAGGAIVNRYYDVRHVKVSALDKKP